MSATGGHRERKSPLLIITVEDDVRCCLSMFRINFRWTKTAAVCVAYICSFALEFLVCFSKEILDTLFLHTCLNCCEFHR